MIITVPKDESERLDFLTSNLKREVVKLAMQIGVPYDLVDDSKSIDKSIENIVYCLNRIYKDLKYHGTNTNFYSMDDVFFKPIKKCVFNNELDKTIKGFKKMGKLTEGDYILSNK